jgi:hypothetical protein
MSDLTLNIPNVVDEVSQAFERYEKGLLDSDVEVLDDTFWNSPQTIRYARDRQGYGFDEIHAHRLARPAGIMVKDVRRRLVITTFGQDLATVNMEYTNKGTERIGRQSQTWVRMQDAGWKVVSAHVSFLEDPAA